MDNNSIVVTAEEMIRLRKEYLRSTSLDETNLIEISGISCAWHLLHNFGPFNEDHIVVCAGQEENGSLGLSIAFYLAKYTKKITVCMPLAPLHPSTIQNKKRLVNFYPEIEFTSHMVNGDLYIDALLDAKESDKEIHLEIQEIIKTLNHQTSPLIAIDVPSGISNAGKTEIAVNADVTLAVGMLMSMHKQKHCGQVSLIDIGLPNSLIAKHSVIFEKAS
jgi:NAD(P)H-hydrate repair Nnr-like enzyme with NAD(P)H-hydrate epimerase domain